MTEPRLSPDSADTPRRPQDWITLALQGFFADEGRTMGGGAKGSLAAKLVLACAGIQGEVEVAPFERLLTDAGSPRSLRQRAVVDGAAPTELETKIAVDLWHRFGNPSIVEWEDETHKAEYIEATLAVIFLVNRYQGRP